MPTMNEYFVEQSARLSAYRGSAEDNEGVEPHYPPATDVDEFFQWLTDHTHSVRSLMPQRNQDPRFGIGSVIIFRDQTQATVHSTWIEDHMAVGEGDELRPFEDANVPGGRWVILRPAGASGLAYFNRMERLQQADYRRVIFEREHPAMTLEELTLEPSL